ncbi:hypothetical protein [Nocardioides sp.]|uniref:hypothetical protein n=1 Tax=Nocardioides sp. TaxID=35761 RepID=UPI002733F86B|nr:hypothetical protein [Nocardioides sp.]MDP3890852.1 hypothetical protein [Nocardioides sp.]
MSSPALQLRSRVPRIAEAAVERARLTVVPRRRTRAAKVPFVTLVTLILVGGVVGLLLFNTSMQQASFAATSLEAQARTLNAHEQTLRRELDDLRDPQRVAQEAQQLGMVPSVNPAFIDITDGSVLGEPRAATPEDGLRIRPNPVPKPKVLSPPPLVIEVVGTAKPERGARAQNRERREQRRDRRGGQRRADRSGDTARGSAGG